jgi:hypothetical protein
MPRTSKKVASLASKSLRKDLPRKKEESVAGAALVARKKRK